MTQIDIPVGGLHCAGCERTLSAALRRLPGVHDAQADRAAGKVSVAFDETRLGAGDLRSHIERLGYDTR
jgi:copper chaperone CopZ